MLMAEFVAVQLITWLAGAAAATGATLALTTAAVSVALSVGISLAASMLLSPSNGRPQAGVPPSDRTFFTRSSTVPRSRSYGRVKIAGNQQFAAAKGGRLYRVLAHGEGPIDAVEEHWIDDTEIDLDGSGDVTTAKYVTGGVPRVHLEWTPGASTGLHYTAVASAFPEWNSDHLGKGVHHSLVVLTQPAQTEISEMFPRYENTNYAQVIRGAKVYDPREESHDPDDPTTWAWSTNAPLCILDFLRHDTGMGFPWAFIEPEIAAWEAAADTADEAVTLKAGGTVPRYQLCGTYGFDERRASVLGRMLATCDGRMSVGQNGGLRLVLPSAAEPTVTIDGDAVVAYTLGSGNEAPDTATVVRAVYLEPGFGHVETDAEPWRNEAAVTAFGEISTEIVAAMVPSHSQARRLMKLAAARAAPEWRGQVVTNLLALPAISERYVRLVIPEADFDERVEIQACRFRIGEGSTVVGLTIEWASAGVTETAWDAETEEGRTPERGPAVGAGNALPVPANFAALVAEDTSGSVTYPYAILTWDDLGVDSLTVEIRYRIQGSGSTFTVVEVPSDETTARTGPLTTGAIYEFFARTRGQSERVGEDTAGLSVIAEAGTTYYLLAENGDRYTLEDGQPLTTEQAP